MKAPVKITKDSPVTVLPGVGEVKAKAYAKLGVFTLSDLLFYYPRAYEDRSTIYPLAASPADGKCAVVLVVGSEPKLVRLRSRKTFLKFRAFDESGTCEITYFNQDYLKSVFSVGSIFRFYGKVERAGKKYAMSSPAAEPWVEEAPPPPLYAVYKKTDGLTQKQIQKDVAAAMELLFGETVDPLPEEIREKRGLCDKAFALAQIHRPDGFESLNRAKNRLIYEEFFLFSLGIATTRLAEEKSYAFPLKRQNLSLLFSRLPFALTASQKTAISEICADLAKETPMRRMLVGDVGSGKTVCAAAAMLCALQNGRQAVLMAPTEILARQHFLDLSPLFEALGYKTALLLGATPAAEKRKIREGLSIGAIGLVIGTHVLLSEGVEFFAPGVVVTDEQHRFGAAQRAQLSEKNQSAHLLVMSATPIPRSLALTLYGDLDVSRLTELPPGRQRVDTYAVDETFRERVNTFIEKQVADGGQVFVICPSVEEREGGELSLSEIGAFGPEPFERPPMKAAVTHAKELAERFPDVGVACLHGRMKSKEKEAVMAAFVSGETKILVSTTVVEVGVNIPNASLMLIENAERFGLSQLHQLRGRVGRGNRKSYCILAAGQGSSEKALGRLRVLATTYDGYAIAEADLRERGPGDFLAVSEDGGVRQSGGLSFRLADAGSDLSTLLDATADAKELLQQDAALSGYPALKEELQKAFTIKTGYIS
ncbi:MAG: ATP-dependent DNA helicase RecG [Clostridia bacterium]|nr:ATP-dependent DNA helicase RecG [Clostridia bacterium]